MVLYRLTIPLTTGGAQSLRPLRWVPTEQETWGFSSVPASPRFCLSLWPRWRRRSPPSCANYFSRVVGHTSVCVNVDVYSRADRVDRDIRCVAFADRAM